MAAEVVPPMGGVYDVYYYRPDGRRAGGMDSNVGPAYLAELAADVDGRYGDIAVAVRRDQHEAPLHLMPLAHAWTFDKPAALAGVE